MVYQVHRLMSPIPEKLFSLSGISCDFPGESPLRESLWKARNPKSKVTWQILLKFALALIFLAAAGSVFCQNMSKETAYDLKSDPRGKSIFEVKCATCHGLDGLGGEHAPDIIRRAGTKALSDEALLNVIHDGIPEEGMPGFPSIGQEEARAVVAYLRFLQGGSIGKSVPGDPARGRDLFVGKSGCSTCHQIGGRGQFATGDVAGFARDHAAEEVRDAILKPAEGPQESATAVARNGRKFTGKVRNEDDASVQLQDSDGRFYLLMKSSLVSIQRKQVDPMPADYGQRLSNTELDDLVAYIVREARRLDPSSTASAEAHAQD